LGRGVLKIGMPTLGGFELRRTKKIANKSQILVLERENVDILKLLGRSQQKRPDGYIWLQ
jgi:hypothetical protein